MKITHGDFNNHWMEHHPESIDLIMVDPPYGILERAGQTWDVAINWQMMERIFSQLLNPHGWVIIFCNLKLLFLLNDLFGKKLQFKHFHIWRKPGGSPANKYGPILDSEHIACFHRSDARIKNLIFNPWESGVTGAPYAKKNGQRTMKTKGGVKSEKSINSTGKRYIRTILEAPGKPNMIKSERTDHPTQKPLSLVRELVRVYSNPGDTILSPFAGSGTDLLAAEEEARNSYGYEIVEEYFLEAQERINSKIES